MPRVETLPHVVTSQLSTPVNPWIDSSSTSQSGVTYLILIHHYSDQGTLYIDLHINKELKSETTYTEIQSTTVK
ncbi:Uncharacterized protein HZ326_23458 [Fusarium oxysporum f. sp. albedinis]|nr:Uncharacterized protein HZ326_23458 [Fusarium oxysporum f. sp. albedinis]